MTPSSLNSLISAKLWPAASCVLVGIVNKAYCSHLPSKIPLTPSVFLILRSKYIISEVVGKPQCKSIGWMQTNHSSWLQKWVENICKLSTIELITVRSVLLLEGSRTPIIKWMGKSMHLISKQKYSPKQGWVWTNRDQVLAVFLRTIFCTS